MNLFDTLKSWSAAVLPSMPMPKAPKGGVSIPGYRRNVVSSKAALREQDRQLATADRIVNARAQSKTRKVVRELVKSSPDLSSAASSLLRVGIPERYTVVARNMDGVIDPAATGAAHELLRRVTYMGNADGSMGTQQGLQSLSEQLGLELLIEGGACLEVALDKARVPASFNPVPVSTFRFYEEENRSRFVQVVGGVEIDLDLPTIIYTTVDQYLTEAYPSSYYEAAIQPVFQDIEFTDASRRALRRAVLPRLSATVDSDKVKKMTPPDVLADPVKFADYKNTIIDQVEKIVNGLSPEDVLVSYDAITYAYIDGGKDPSTIIEKIQSVLNGKLAAGAKTMPTVLGHGSGSNTSSTEAVLYLKQANMLRVKLNEIYSRALTVATRLLGNDVYVEFRYAALDLRPEGELEAFKAMEQSRLLMQLSLGMITDEEACILLTGNLPPPGYKPKSGTMFMSPNQATITNPSSNTSAISQSTTSDAPKQPKS
jgi:hypothetical protein